jgi:hypothetical protein
MKKVIIVVVGTFSLSLALGLVANAQVPKEGTTSFTSTLSCTFKALPMGKENVQMTYECMGVMIGDTPEDLFHNASLRCLGALHVVKGEYNDDRCFCVSKRPDGDQIFSSYEGAGKAGGMYKGTWTIVGGTGKLVGIQGSVEATGTSTPHATEGTFQIYDRDKGHYKLP